jgi:hypothetical protein
MISDKFPFTPSIGHHPIGCEFRVYDERAIRAMDYHVGVQRGQQSNRYWIALNVSPREAPAPHGKIRTFASKKISYECFEQATHLAGVTMEPHELDAPAILVWDETVMNKFTNGHYQLVVTVRHSRSDSLE